MQNALDIREYTPGSLGYMPITITSIALKKGKPDKIELDAYCSQLPDNTDERVYTLSKSSRDFQRRRFQLEIGCTISDSTGDYVCTAVHYTSHPKFPILFVKPSD